MMQLYLARHGQTELNKTKVYFGRLDVHIDDAGAAQCERISECLKNIKFDAILSSSLQRAVESAQIMCGESGGGICIKTFEALCEIDFGKWEGLHHSEVQERYPQHWKAWSEDWINYRLPDGESFLMFYERVRNCFEQIREEYRDRTVLLVAHEGTLKIIATLLLGLKAESYWSFHFEYGKYSRFDIHDELAVVRCINCMDELPEEP